MSWLRPWRCELAFPFQVEWGWMQGKKFRVVEPVSTTVGHFESGGTEIAPGTIVRVTMVSGMGDLGVSTDLSADRGYNHRASPWELEMLPDEEYSFIFDPDQDPRFQHLNFDFYKKEIVLWTVDVLDRSWWTE